MSSIPNGPSTMRQFYARLYFPEGVELFRRGFVPVLFVSLLSALLQSIVEGVMPPSAVPDTPDGHTSSFSLAFVITLVIRSVEATVIYAVLTTRHPGAQWSFHELRIETVSRVCLMLLALIALVLGVVPLLGPFSLPILIVMLTLASVAPVPMLCEGWPAMLAFRHILRAAAPVIAPFFGFSTLVIAFEQTAGWLARTALGESEANLLVTGSVALADAITGALSAAIFVAMYFRLSGPRKGT